MIEVHLAPADVYPWRTEGSTRIRGDRVAGPVAIVEEVDGGIRASVDRCRSFPLFWATRGEHLWVSDDARWVRDRAGDEAMDGTARAEVFLSGFVTGSRTLFPSVRQLRAGETLLARPTAGGFRIETRFEGEEGADEPTSDPGSARRRGAGPGPDPRVDPADERARFAELDEIWRRVIDRLLASLAGRPLVVPLTGGHDSRLVALLAKEAGYDRILCLGSQRRDSWEARTSRDVAERLGLEWAHFGYEPAQWRAWWSSEERRCYARFADGLSATPPILEWPAARELRRSGRVGEDAVIVPGHFGDFVAGSSDPPPESAGRSATRASAAIEAAVDRIRRSRFVLRPPPAGDPALSRALDERLRESVREAAGAAAAVPTSVREIVDRWEWREYRGKQEGACARIYEFFGWEWRFPHADDELVRFWRAAAPAERYGAALHRRWVVERGRRWDLPPANPGVGTAGASRARRWAGRLGLLGSARRLRRLARRLDGRGISRADDPGWAALFDPREVRRTYTGLEGVESYLASDWLESLER